MKVGGVTATQMLLEYSIYRKSLEHVEKIEHVEMTNGQNYMKNAWREETMAKIRVVIIFIIAQVVKPKLTADH